MENTVLAKFLEKIEDVYEKYQIQEKKISSQFQSTCYKGCGACCHFPLISSTAGEAFVLYNILIQVASNKEELNSHLRSYAAKYFANARAEGSLPFTQEQQKKAFFSLAMPCPLFQKTNDPNSMQGHCAAFQMRPLICGYFHSLDDPELCLQKEPHRTYGPAIAAGEEAIDEIQTFERIVLGRSTLGHLPLLLAAMSYEKGQKAFLRDDFHNSETNSLPPEEAQWSYDFDLFIELIAAAGYSITESDIHSLLAAQKELKRN